MNSNKSAKILVIHNLNDLDNLNARIAQLLEVPEAKIQLLKLKKGFSEQIPKDIDEIIMAGGSDLKLANSPKLKEEIFEFVRNCQLPIIGICFGAQLIARAYGAKIVQLSWPRSHLINIRIIKDKQIFGNKYVQTVYNRHSWTLQDLPEDFTIYGCSSGGIEMFAHRSKKIAGVQFHPELFMGTNQGAELFRQLRSLMLTKNG